MNKTLSNTNPEQAAARGVQFKGNPDLFRTIAKAWNVAEKWMKSTKAMEIPGAGCLVQVTTQQGEHVAEALAFVPGVRVKPDGEGLEAIPTGTKAEPEPRARSAGGAAILGAGIGLTQDLGDQAPRGLAALLARRRKAAGVGDESPPPGLMQALRDGNIDVGRLDADELRMCVKALLES